MEIPTGFEAEREDNYVLQIHKNIYGQNQAAQVWNKYIWIKLNPLGFASASSRNASSTKASLSIRGTEPPSKQHQGQVNASSF